MKNSPLPRTCLSIATLGLFFASAAALAQTPKPTPKPAQANASVPVLLISDIHFEPFWDPVKVAKLNAATPDKWDAILAPPASPKRKQAFAAFLQQCACGDGDTSSVLFDTSLKNMRLQAAGVAFVTVSGDLISHQFDKKYATAFRGSTDADYSAFVEKTIQYVVGKLYAAFPGVPVYVALGNNDTDCQDYWIDAGSDFLKDIGLEVAMNFPATEKTDAEASFHAGGYYSVSLPAPIQNARLLVLDDLFMSDSYRTCAGGLDPGAAAHQISWLDGELAKARARQQKVWVMGHIPPGVDLYDTSKIIGGICGGTQKPAMFLSSEKMADVMAGYADVIQLAIFAHTHMDELRLLKDNSNATPLQPPGPGKAIPLKMVSSISPIHDNHPSITLAQVDPSTAALVDYSVFSSPDLTGDSTAKWKQEYDFGTSYNLAAFSASTLTQLIATFAADPGRTTQDSTDYIGDYSAGHTSSFLQTYWPQYVCTLSNHTDQAFKACLCSTAH
ncbi:MAG: metallophosphoesterase [Terracidiphilus sp.]